MTKNSYLGKLDIEFFRIMSSLKPILPSDLAQEWLCSYLIDTERLLRSAVGSKFKSKTQIKTAFDLCVPHDVIRLLGGFATGVYVSWDASSSFVPVDICMNTDVSSVFYLDKSCERVFTEKNLKLLREWIENKTTYIWNFDNGNHFVSFARARSGEYVLVMHSNEKEFKLQGNGLVPTVDNWFFDNIQTISRKGRYLRYLSGEKATVYYQLAKSLEEYSINRHRIFAAKLLGNEAKIVNEYHKMHYYMPSSREAVLGSYLCKPSEVVPIFSYPGGPIYWFKAMPGGKNTVVRPDGSKGLLVGHGYGKTFSKPISLEIKNEQAHLNGVSYPIEPQMGTSKHPDFALREFDDNPMSEKSIFSLVKQHTPGNVVNIIDQLAWSCSSGFASKL